MASDMLKEVGNALKHQRQQIKVSQETVATRSGISYRYYQSVEGGKSSAGIRVLFRICRGLGCHYSAILEQAWRVFNRPDSR